MDGIYGTCEEAWKAALGDISSPESLPPPPQVFLSADRWEAEGWATGIDPDGESRLCLITLFPGEEGAVNYKIQDLSEAPSFTRWPERSLIDRVPVRDESHELGWRKEHGIYPTGMVRDEDVERLIAALGEAFAERLEGTGMEVRIESNWGSPPAPERIRMVPLDVHFAGLTGDLSPPFDGLGWFAGREIRPQETLAETADFYVKHVILEHVPSAGDPR